MKIKSSRISRHIPVMLEEVLNEFESLKIGNESLVVIDCTLGQAGHSVAIFNKLKKGVLLSIDKNPVAIDWVSREYGFDGGELRESEKVWKLICMDFSRIEDILDREGFAFYDFLIADLGFSALELRQNLGISYSRLSQRLDMRYSQDEGVGVAELLNSADCAFLQKLFVDYGEIPEKTSRDLAIAIVRYRRGFTYRYVRDLVEAIGKFGSRVRVKVFQALRSFVNDEPEKLRRLLEAVKRRQSLNGKSLIISFNNLEEKIIKQTLGVARVLHPNIKEIIANVQSRSAKLHIYERNFSTTQE